MERQPVNSTISLQKLLRTLTPEDRLTLLCAQSQLDDFQRNSIKDIITSDLNWKLFLLQANTNSIPQLVYHHLSHQTLRELVPPDILKQLKQKYYGNTARNLHLWAETQSIVRAFEQEKIQVILLKGIALAETVYHDIGLRQMNDIDLLLRDKDIPSGMKILHQLNYQSVPKKTQFVEDLRLDHQNSFYKDSFLVELHWDIVSLHSIYTADIEALWNRSQLITIDKRQVRIFSTEDMLIHLGLHLHKHINTREIRLSWLTDIAAILWQNKATIDWPAFIRTIEKYEIQWPMYCVLSLAEEFLNAPLSPYVQKLRKNYNYDTCRKKFILLLKNQSHKYMASSNVDYRKKLKMIKGTSRKIRYVLGVFFPSQQFIRQSYHPHSAMAVAWAYVRHFFRTLSRIGRNIISRWIGA